MHHDVNEFLTHLAEERGLSHNTVMAYHNDLAQFIGFCQQRDSGDGPVSSWAEVSPLLVTAYVGSLMERDYAPATVARKLAAVKSLFGYLSERNVVGKDPSREVKGPRVEKIPPRSLSAEEMDALRAAVSRRQTPEGQRDRAMLEVLYGTGMRVTELVSLDLGDVRVEANLVRVGAGSPKERDVPVAGQVSHAVKVYLEEGRPRLARRDSSQALFLNRRGLRITRQGLWLLLKSYASEAGIGRGISPQTLRHSHAAHHLNAGADLDGLRERLGHSSIASTQVYRRFAAEESG